MAVKIKRKSNIPSEKKPAKQKKDLGRLTIKTMALKDLHPADYNPRIMDSNARTGLSNSIDDFGLLEPIVVNTKTGNIVGGHQRYYDLLRKKVTHTDVSIVNISPEKERAANIALNNPKIQGVFTDDLQEILGEMEEGLKDRYMLKDLEVEDTIEKMIDEDTGQIKDKVKKRKVHRQKCPKCDSAAKLVCTSEVCGMEW